MFSAKRLDAASRFFNFIPFRSDTSAVRYRLVERSRGVPFAERGVTRCQSKADTELKNSPHPVHWQRWPVSRRLIMSDPPFG